MQCATHEQREAAGFCVYCGKPFCRDCLVEVEGRLYCLAHATMHVRSDKSSLVALLLCLFLGYLGIHRFYAGKIGTGLIWFFTGGFFGLGWLVDFVMILLGNFRDGRGYPMR